MKKKFYGKYTGFVYDNNDPKKLGRLRLFVPEVGFVDKPTDWAFPCLQYGGGMDIGDVKILDIIDKNQKRINVWVEFEAGDANRPIWTGVYWSEPKGVSEIPKLAKGEVDESVVSITHCKGTAEDTFAAEYPNNKVFKTKSGIIFEWDDTPGAIRIKVWHPTGTFFDIDNSGNMRQKIIGNLYQEIMGDYLELVHGDFFQKVTVEIYRKADGDIEDYGARVLHKTNSKL